MTSSESDLNDVEAANRVENEKDNLPRGSERELIEYYFNRGHIYRNILLMSEKHHDVYMNEQGA